MFFFICWSIHLIGASIKPQIISKASNKLKTNMFQVWHLQKKVYAETTFSYHTLYMINKHECTEWPIWIWTILRGCLEVTGWLKIKNFNSSKKFMQIPLKVNKVYLFDIKHGLTMTLWIFFSKSKNYAIPMYGLQYP